MEKSQGSIALRLALADALDIVADAVIMLDKDQHILFFNKGAESIFGYHSEEILGQPLDLLLPSRFITAHHEHIRAFSAGPQVAKQMGDLLQVRGRRKDGSEFPAETSISKLAQKGQTTFTVIVRDVTERLEADKALRKWMHIFENAEWGVVVGSADGNTLEMMNPAFARMHGYTVEELAGRLISDVFSPDCRQELRDQIHVAQEKGHYTFESKHIRKDGTVFPALVDVTAVKNEEGIVLYHVVHVQDITERKRAEEALRESEARYRSMVTAMQEGIVFQDADGHIIACNASAEHMLGLSYDQMIGRTSLDPRWQAVHEDGLPFPGDTHPAMVTLRTGQPQSNVIMGVHKPDGALTWISINSQPLLHVGETRPYAVVTSFTDITERRQAEAALLESEKQYRSIFESVNDGLIITTMDGRIVEANPAACQMNGYTHAEFLSLDPLAVIHPDYRHLFAEFIEQVKAGKEFEIRAVSVRKDGTQFDVEVRGTQFMYKGRPHVLGVLRDITARKRAENALREQEALLRNILEILPVGVWIQDKDGQIVSGNEAGQRIWAGARYVGIDRFGQYKGWWADTGKPIEPEEWAAARAITKGETSLDEVVNIECFDGTRKTILNSAVPIRDANQTIKGAIIVNQDVTERVQAYQLLEQRVEERTRELSTLLEISRDVTSTLELKPLLSLILEQLKSVVTYTSAAIFTLENEELVILEYDVPVLQRSMQPLRLSLERAGHGREVIRCQEPVIIDDVQGDIPLARAVQGMSDKDVKTIFSYAHSWMGIPLMVKDRVIGMLGLAYSEPGYYTSQHARLALTIANQAAVAMENARLYEQARQLSALEERQRLARELHDSVSQALYSIALGARTARTLLDRDPAKAAEPLDYVRSLAEAGLAEMRALIFELRPESLEVEGLVAALTKQADALRARHGIEVHVSFCQEPSMSLDVREALYRIAQEALHNIVKHARASQVNLSLACSDATVIMEVRDNGLGFDASGPFPGHLGLRSMRERAERVGGKFEVESAPGNGTRIRVQVSESAAQVTG